MRTNHRCFFASGTDVVLAKHPLVPQDTILGVLLRVQEFLEWWEGVRMGFMWGVLCIAESPGIPRVVGEG